MPNFEGPVFIEAYTYTGHELGVICTPENTRLRLWAPTAERVELCLYESDGGAEDAVLPMLAAENGTWKLTLTGDRRGWYYRYRVTQGGQTRLLADPYATASGANGEYGQLLDLRDTDPDGFQEDVRPFSGVPTDAVIYELHVRDFTVHPTSGVRHPGLYPGLAESGTRSPEGFVTGLDHLRELGVTHVQLMPCCDFVYEPGKEYNWGYNPRLWFVPEGSYATDASDGAVRIREFKAMVQALHRAGIAVIMDMVLNHSYTLDGPLERAVPGYYYRFREDGTPANGSGCGNETASERPMMRRLMLDCLRHWVQEYHIDGFRLDLMGLHDLDTVQAMRDLLDGLAPGLLLYGEGWTGGDSPLPPERRAVKSAMTQLPGVGAFSNDLRDGIRGGVFSLHEPGFIGGDASRAEDIRFGIAAATEHPGVNISRIRLSDRFWAASPEQCIQYSACHDNHTLWDRLLLCFPQSDEEARLSMQRLAAAAVLLSQGVPLLLAFEECARSKQGVANSYNAPDEINAVNWSRKAQYRSLFDYYRGLIALRREHPAFRLVSAADLRVHLSFLQAVPPGTVAFTLDGHAGGDSARTLLVILNGGPDPVSFALPDSADWVIYADSRRAATQPIGVARDSVALPGTSACVLARAGRLHPIVQPPGVNKPKRRIKGKWIVLGAAAGAAALIAALRAKRR